MKYGRQEMNLKFAELCAKYDLDHWLWVPVDFLVCPTAQKAAEVPSRAEAFYKECPRIDAVFVPGGDPGDNPLKNLLPYVEQMAAVLRKYHPHAKIWISLQRPQPGDDRRLFRLRRNEAARLVRRRRDGAERPVDGDRTAIGCPSSTSSAGIPTSRISYAAQYPIPWLDPAWGVTLGREPVNPRPVDYAAIYHNDYRFTDGFLSYSDGIHDDFNKNLWTQLGWEPDRPVREIAAEYARFFFRPDMAEVGADAILGSGNQSARAAWPTTARSTAPCGYGNRSSSNSRARRPTGDSTCTCSAPTTTPTRGTGRSTRPTSKSRRSTSWARPSKSACRPP